MVISNIKNVLKVSDLRNKILFTIGMLIVYRIGVAVRVPGIDGAAVDQLREQSRTAGALGFLNLFSGGAFASFAVFALGIMPYITASIIMQVLGVVIPKFEQWQQQGAVGQRKLTQATRYLAIAIALLQASGLTYIFGTGRGQAFFGNAGNVPNVVLLNPFMPRALLAIISLVAGTALLMWIGEVISQRGIGNGMSVLIFASVVDNLPRQYKALLDEKKVVVFVVLIIVSLLTLVAVVRMELGQRRIPVQFAKRVVGRRMYGGQNTYIPLKVNQAGVVPIIFASSVLLLPVLLTNVIGVRRNDQGEATGFRSEIIKLVDKYIVNSHNVVYVVVFSVMIVAFAYFYNAIAFDPIKQADQIRRQGGFIPGIRPGPQTERYLAKVVNRITLPGALFIAVIAILPNIVLWIGDTRSFPFGGTTVLIAVGVALEVMRQIDSQLMLRNYEGFLK